MDFSEALRAAKAGMRVARSGWNGKGMWVSAQFPDRDSKMTRAYLFIQDANGDFGPWTPSSTDLFVEDWVIMAQSTYDLCE